MSYFYVAMTILLTVYGQIALKWQVGAAGVPPADWPGRARFLGALLAQPVVLSAFAAAFGAALCWMLAISRLELSHAYPFVSLSFVLVLALSALFFGEPVSWEKVLGVTLIVAGVAVSSRG